MDKFVWHPKRWVNKADVLFNTGNDLFCTLGPKEFYKTVGYKELAFIYGSTVKPYQVTTKWINRLRYQVQNGTSNRTLQNNAEKEGSELTNHIIEKSKTILQDNGFAENGEFQGNNTFHTNDNVVTISNERIIKFAGEMPALVPLNRQSILLKTLI